MVAVALPLVNVASGGGSEKPGSSGSNEPITPGPNVATGPGSNDPTMSGPNEPKAPGSNDPLGPITGGIGGANPNRYWQPLSRNAAPTRAAAAAARIAYRPL
jgi:hypothetical protein